MARRSDADPPGVDFVLGPLDAGADEELPQPADVGSTGGSRLRVVGIVLVLVVVLAALIARGITTHQSRPIAQEPVTSSTPPSTPAATATTHAPTVVIRDDPAHGPADCPRSDDGQLLCNSQLTVGAPVVAAVRTQFPGARIGAVLDEHLRDIGFGAGGLWYRSIHATRGTSRIEVVVRVVRVSDVSERSAEPSEDGKNTTITVQNLTGSFVVKVSVTASTAHLPSFLTLAALAADKRLFAA